MDPIYSLYLESDLNRVFGRAVPEVAAAELRIVADLTLTGRLGPIERRQVGRARVLQFPFDGPADELARMAARLSASAALFQHHQGRKGGPAELLEPLPLEEHLSYGTELVSIQRYRGKTNERLTRAMLNLALATAGVPVDRQPDGNQPMATVLDPMCGRGTTLNWALAYGLDAVGVEIDRSSLDHHRIFIETWAKRQRLPHKATRHREGNAEQRWLSFRVAVDRAALRADRAQRIETFHGDAADPDLPLAKGSIDTVVTDLPYGVQHRNRSGGGPDPTASDPLPLLERCLPVWRRWLRARGSLCLAWNLKQADRRAVSGALASAGFDPVVAEGGFSMRHVVDTTIDRDVIVAVST